MTLPLLPVPVWIVRLPGPDSGDPAEVLGRAAAVDPWAAVGPSALLDEDPTRLAALTEGDTGPAAVGVLGVHPVGDDEGALLEVAAALEAPDLDESDLATLAAHLPGPGEGTLAAAGGGGPLVAALARLRSLPVLSGVARAVPAHWQRRVKNWLQR